MKTSIRLIAAVARDGAIGKDNTLLWRLPEDLQFFKRTTMGCPVIMGRKTYESIGRPLPGRRNVVVTRNPQWQAPHVDTVSSLGDAMALLGRDTHTAYVIGGAQIYEQALPLADEIVLTEIDRTFPQADAFFPAWDKRDFIEVAREVHHASPPNDFDYAFVTYRRR